VFSEILAITVYSEKTFCVLVFPCFILCLVGFIYFAAHLTSHRNTGRCDSSVVNDSFEVCWLKYCLSCQPFSIEQQPKTMRFMSLHS